MQSASQTAGLSLELFHPQTNTSFKLPLTLSVIRIGKQNDQVPPDIDVSSLPDVDVVSRIHAEIRVQGSNFFIEDLGSSNGTFLNNTKLEPKVRYSLNSGDKITLGQAGKVTFIFQNKQTSVSPPSQTSLPKNADLKLISPTRSQTDVRDTATIQIDNPSQRWVMVSFTKKGEQQGTNCGEKRSPVTQISCLLPDAGTYEVRLSSTNSNSAFD